MPHINTMLIAVDLRENDAEICTDAIVFAKTMKSEVTLIHAIEYIPYYPYFPYDEKKIHDDLVAELSEKMEKLKGLFEAQGVHVDKFIIEQGHAYNVICKAADDINACAIVVGLGQHYLLENLIGSTTEKVTRIAHQKVIIINKEKHRNLDRILCAYDFSENSEKALDSAIHMAKLANAELTILHIIQEHFYFNPASPVLTSDSEIYEEHHSKLTDVTKKVNEILHNKLNNKELSTLNYKVATANGDPVIELFKYIETHDTDLLSLGSSGHSKIARFFLGSNTEKILRKAPCSIMTSKK